MNATNQIPKPPIDLKRNQIAFWADSMFFGLGMYFMSINTVLVSLASKLTDDKALIGMIPLAWQASWMLPQLFAARLIRGKSSMRPTLVIPALIFRPAVLLMALWLYSTHAQQATLTVWLLVAMIIVFLASDSLVTASWFDILARTLSQKVKGSIMTSSGVISSVFGIGAGAIVTSILSNTDIAFPNNYALLLACGFFTQTISTIALILIREVPPSQINPETHEHNFVKHLKNILSKDAVLRKVMTAKILTSMESIAAAFYVVFARERLGLPDASIGVFTTAVVIGGIIGTATFGWLFNRFGAKRVINSATTAQFIAPTLAFIVSLFAAQAVGSSFLAYAAFFVIMAINGAINRSNMLGFMTYAQQRASEHDRPIYIGVMNTMAGFTALMPVIGGFMLDGLLARGFGNGAYSVVFAIALTLVGAGTWLGYRLPKV